MLTGTLYLFWATEYIVRHTSGCVYLSVCVSVIFSLNVTVSASVAVVLGD